MRCEMPAAMLPSFPVLCPVMPACPCSFAIPLPCQHCFSLPPSLFTAPEQAAPCKPWLPLRVPPPVNPNTPSLIMLPCPHPLPRSSAQYTAVLPNHKATKLDHQAAVHTYRGRGARHKRRRNTDRTAGRRKRPRWTDGGGALLLKLGRALNSRRIGCLPSEFGRGRRPGSPAGYPAGGR